MKNKNLYLSGLAIFLTSSLAHAANLERAVDRINGSYDPRVSVESPSQDEANAVPNCQGYEVMLAAVDPVTRKQGQVQLKQYMPDWAKASPSDVKTVIIFPPTGGENILDRLYADIFCAAGMRAVIIEHFTGDDDSSVLLSVHDHSALRSIAAIRHTLEYLSPSSPTRVGLLGTSLGAIDGAMAVGFDQRIGTATFIVGGGDVANIIAESDLPALKALGQERARSYGFNTLAAYEYALHEFIDIEPLQLSGLSGSKKVLFFMGLQDRTVPTAYQKELYEAFGSQELVTYEGDHFDTIVHTFFFHHRKILDFFRDNLK
jgi:hypothetical protein